jgi:hypothetical protein
MTWARLDDNFPHHPKVVAAGPIAALIQVRAICYCARHLTDGFLPDAVVPELLLGFDGIGIYAPRRLREGKLATVGYDADELDWVAIMLRHGLWEKRKGGYYVHDYPDYNPTRADVLAEREARRKGGLKGAKITNTKRWASTPDAAEGQLDASTMLSPPSRPSTPSLKVPPGEPLASPWTGRPSEDPDRLLPCTVSPLWRNQHPHHLHSNVCRFP